MKRPSGWSQLCARMVWAVAAPLLIGLPSLAAAAPDVAGGSHTSVAIKSDGSLWAWGDQVRVQYAGESLCTHYSGTPRLISTGFVSVATGANFSVAIKADGSLWGWGTNYRGALTNGIVYDGTCFGAGLSGAPQQIGTGFAKVSAGDDHTVAIKTDGSLWVWGWDIYGQLGDGSAPDYFVDVITSNATPQQIGTGFASVSAGAQHTVAIKTDGSLWAWGDNTYGQLGDGTFDALSNGVSQHPTPKQIGDGFATVFAGSWNTFAIKTDGSLWAWGRNTDGQLGDGTLLDINPIPQQIGVGFVSVVASYLTTFAIKTDGSLWAWGNNIYGQFGDGTSTASLIPKLVGTGFAKVAVSKNRDSESYIAIKTDGSLWAWGFTSYLQIGDGDYSTQYHKTPKQIFSSGFEMSLLSVGTTQQQVSSPQLITAQLTLINDQNTSLTITPYLLEKDGVQYAPDAADDAVAIYEAPTANTLKVNLAPITLGPRETKVIDVPIVIARPDLSDPAVATAMSVDFGVVTSDSRDIKASLNLNVSPRSEPAAPSALQQRLRTGPVADLGVGAATAGAAQARARQIGGPIAAISTDLPSVNGDYWNLWVLTEMAKKPEGDEDRKFYRKLMKKFGFSARDAYAVLYLRAIANLKPEKAGKTGWFKLAKGGAQLWVEAKKVRWGLTPDFNTPARTILEGLDSVNALYFLNLLELSSSYSAPLVSAMSDNFAAFASTYTRTSQALCDYMQNGTLISLPFPRMVEADLAYYMTSNGRWHPKIHNTLFGGVTVRNQAGQPQTLSRFLEEFMLAYPKGEVPGCPINAGQRQWVRIDVHSPILPLVTDSQGRRFGIDAQGILHEEIPHAYIDPGHPWSMAVAVPDGALTIDYALAYPFPYGIEVHGLFDGINTGTHVTQGAATASFSLKQQGAVSNTGQGVSISLANIFDNGSQTISFGVAPHITVGGTGTVSATTTSGLAVNFTSATPGVCTVSANTVTAIAAGTCTIAANQAGNATYSAASQVTQNITVSAAAAIPACTLSASPIVISAGSYATLTASCTPAATSLTWTNSGFAPTVGSGTVSPTKPTMYTVFGTNSAGSSAAATTAVYVCNTPPSQTYPGLTLTGTAAAEQFASGIANDRIDGGAGVDAIVYACNKDSFTITKTASGWAVSSAAEGLDTLTNVERIKFGNETLALDISGNAGQTYRLYQAAFNRVPDNAGLKYWIDVMDSGISLKDVALGFMGVSEFKALYGANPTNEDFVTKLYTNILHRAPDPAGYAYWVDTLNAKLITQADALILLSESTENQAGVINAIINGIDLLN